MQVWITLDTQILLDGDEDHLLLELRGTLSTQADSTVLAYTETDADGEQTDVLIHLSPDHASIRRMGATASLLLLQKGVRHHGMLRAGGSLFTVDLLLDSLTETTDGDTRRWDLRYAVYSGPGEPAQHHMVLTARPLI